MKTLLVTGGIGSGKSAVCAYLQERGIPVYDSDGAVKRLYREDPDLLASLEARFGIPLRQADGSLDRRRLAGLLFSDPAALAQLEAVVHPAVLRDFLAWRSRQNAPMVAPLRSKSRCLTAFTMPFFWLPHRIPSDWSGLAGGTAPRRMRSAPVWPSNISIR